MAGKRTAKTQLRKATAAIMVGASYRLRGSHATIKVISAPALSEDGLTVTVYGRNSISGRPERREISALDIAI